MTNYLFLGFIVVVFIMVVLLVQGLYSLWNTYRGPEAKRIGDRLRSVAISRDLSAQSKLVKDRLLSDVPWLERVLLNMPRVRTLDRLVGQSGTGLTAARLLILCGMFALGAFVAAVLTPFPLLVDIAFVLLAGIAPLFVVLRKRRNRLRKMEEQLPEALDFLSRAMRAGHAFSSALSVVGDEGPSVIRGDFRTTFDEINFGIPVEEALRNLIDRVPLDDMRFFVAAVTMQRETGGNLAEILGNISRLVRERLKLYGKVRVLAAEGKMSAWILTLLPFCVAGVILIINRDFMTVLWTDPAGPKMIAVNAVLMMLGILWMWRIVKIRV